MEKKELDLEWVELIKEALLEGISKEDILKYLREKGNMQHQPQDQKSLAL